MPRGTFLACCCQCPCPCGEPLPTHSTTGDPPTLAGSSGSVACGVTAPFLWVFSSVQSLSHVQLFEIPWTAAHQASLSFTIYWSLLKFMSIESVMLFNHLILCHPLLLLPSIFPSTWTFSIKSTLSSGGQTIGALVSATVLPMNIQG